MHGNPTPEEEAAIREAILRIWREDQAEAQRSSGRTPWVEAARVAGIGGNAGEVRGPHAWRWALRITGLVLRLVA